MAATERPEDTPRTFRGLDGRRLPDIREETFQRALEAVKKVMREDYRVLRESIEREKSKS